jgi:hypothetical protein
MSRLSPNLPGTLRHEAKEAAMSLHVPHPHAPHPDFEAHPWRALPAALVTIVLLAALLIGVSFALSKWLTGIAY